MELEVACRQRTPVNVFWDSFGRLLQGQTTLLLLKNSGTGALK